MNLKTSNKSTNRIVCELFLISCIVLLELSFFSEINTFLNNLIHSVGLGSGFWLFVAAIWFYLPIVLIPFFLLNFSFDKLLAQLKATSSPEGLARNLFLTNILAAIFCSFFWALKARGILEAAWYEFDNFNFIMLGAVIFFSYTAANSNLKSTKSLADGLKYAFVICFCCVFYFWFGLDDGCVTTGADPLFGGGGETDCDPDYTKQRDDLGNAGIAEGFNSDAVFAVQYLWMTTASFLTITLVYIFKVRKK